MSRPKVELYHGSLNASKGLAAPIITKVSDRENRPGYNSVNASEYQDTPEVFDIKIKQLVALIKASKNCVIYSGAGISRTAGIPDYASDEGDGIKGEKKLASSDTNTLLHALPTTAHRACVSLYEAGYIKKWVQQNHDGLPQKAGMPQHMLNEIHGAWFDPSNRVVPMSGKLRGDLFEDLQYWCEKADLVLALGTSLAGMNADGIVKSVADRLAIQNASPFFATGKKVLGSVIISIQQTPHDSKSTLRIYSKLDEVFTALAREMNLKVKPLDTPISALETRKNNVFNIPYSEGQLSKTANSILDLNEGSEVVQMHGDYRGAVGIVLPRDRDGNWPIKFKELECPPEGGSFYVSRTRLLGSWWGQSLAKGLVDYAPVMNKGSVKGITFPEDKKWTVPLDTKGEVVEIKPVPKAVLSGILAISGDPRASLKKVPVTKITNVSDLLSSIRATALFPDEM